MQPGTDRPRLASQAHAMAHEILALREASRRISAADMPGTESSHALAILADMIHARKDKVTGIAEQVTHG